MLCWHSPPLSCLKGYVYNKKRQFVVDCATDLNCIMFEFKKNALKI